MRYFIAFLVFISSISVAAIYVETEGEHTTFSDTPSSDSKLLTTPTITTVPPLNKTIEVPSSPIAISKTSYKVFMITSPKDQETIQNQPTIGVNIAIDPPLQGGDKIQLFVDGKPWLEPSISTSYMLDLERGIHQLYATIIDNNKNTLKQSNNVNIYIHRASAIRAPN